MKMVLIRHGESTWNKENLFTGWTDVPLTTQGEQEAARAAALLQAHGFDFDICYTSFLQRAIDTLAIILQEYDRKWLPVIKSWKLNERHYGDLQGLNKAQMAEQFSAEQVHKWRRSLAASPPPLAATDSRHPRLSEQYRTVAKHLLPAAESLQQTAERVISYYESHIHKSLLDGQRIIISAHGNTLRTLVMYFENLNEEEVMKVNIPNCIPLVYEFDWNFKVTARYFIDSKQPIKPHQLKNIWK